MKQLKKLSAIFIIICFSFLPTVASETVVQVAKQEEQSGGMFSFFSIFTSTIFWGAIVLFVFLIAILIGIFFLVRWLVKFIKNKTDIFLRLRTERLKLAKIHRRYPSKAFFKIEKNTPIRLVKQINGKPVITRPIAYHKGDYTTHEGNVIVSLNLVGKKKWFFLPETDLLIIPNNDVQEVITRKSGKKAEQEIVKIDNLPNPDDIIVFNENEILIYAESLSNIGMFLIPVLKDRNGKVIDLSFPVFDSIKKVALGEYLYEQVDDFSKISKKALDINPYIRAITKTGDSSQSVDVPSTRLAE